MAEKIESLLKIEKKFYPRREVVEKAWGRDYDSAYRRSIEDAEKFWGEAAKEISWFKGWDRVLEWRYPYARWFVGAKLNASYNCLDRHVKNEKLAYIFVGENGEEKRITYAQLCEMVSRLANGLKMLGVKKGDRVAIYMPLSIEQIAAMLACARIGAIHSVVYSGFSAQALKMRIEDAEAKVLITADFTYRRGKAIPLKEVADEALQGASVDKVVVWRRKPETPLKQRDVDFYELLESSPAQCEPEAMDSSDALFILYTSGTTGKPKGVVHSTGGYLVGVHYSTKVVFDLKGEDLFWCTADTGWITGHSYIVYGPLSLGAATLIYEGAPDYPDAGAWWRIIEKYKVTVFYTAPTAIRMLMRFGEELPKKCDLSSLRILGTVGEPINPEAWLWYYKNVGRERCPVVDTWWQTETGMVLVTTLPSYPAKPGKAGKALPGIIADVVDKSGNSLPAGKGGLLVIRNPWPAMFSGIYKNPERYEKYWSEIPGVYNAEDVAVKDEEGYIMIIGRADDVIKVAGHRLGTAEIESALVSHPAVVEAAVIGKPDPVKGEAIKAFVLLKLGIVASKELAEELKLHVRREIGPIATPSEIEFADRLPKTRSGKIMRRVLKAREMGMEVGDISTLED